MSLIRCRLPLSLVNAAGSLSYSPKRSPRSWAYFAAAAMPDGQSTGSVTIWPGLGLP